MLGWKCRADLMRGHRKKTNNAQTIKGKQAGCNYNLSGSLVTYQCGEAVGEMPMEISV